MNIYGLKEYMNALLDGGVSAVVNENELYLEVGTDKIAEACRYACMTLNFPLVLMFANDERQLTGDFVIYYVFSDRSNGLFLIYKIQVPEKNPVYPSVATEIHSAAAYEREIFDMFGLKAQGHPDMKSLVFHGNWPDGLHPLRKDFDRRFKPPFVKRDIAFTRVQGEGTYEIPVGPVHAGIIEPGHFRFSVAGEPIINLEAQLSFVHKGIEKLSEGVSIEKCFYISERISGDETYSNSLAFCQAVERLAGITVPDRALYTRVIFAELERLTSHLGDLAGICVDVAYGFAAFQFRMMRGWAYQLADELCGMRFLRSVNKPGGVRKDFIESKEKSVTEMVDRIKKELTDTSDIIKANTMFLDRVENTGILKAGTAVDLNAVGPAARAAGIGTDVRKDFPYAAYKKLDFKVPEHANGDVNCRMNVKLEECFESIELIKKAVSAATPGKTAEPVSYIKPYSYAMGYTESPRGENMHWVMSGENNTIFRYKIRTPSFCNWPAVCHAVKGNIVTDFPLINKSFNLSYAGNDL